MATVCVEVTVGALVCVATVCVEVSVGALVCGYSLYRSHCWSSSVWLQFV